MNTAAPSTASTDSQLVQVLDRYLAALQAGTPPEKEEILAQYPELAADLEACLASLDFIRQGGIDARGREPEEENSPGTRLVSGVLGDYRILREVGRGGMGIVYEAEQLSLGRRVALKVLPFAAAMDAKPLQRFKNEAQAAAHLHHTNIVPVYAVGCERGVHFYAMQYIEGQTLAALIRELRHLVGLEPPDPSRSGARASALANELLSGRWAPVKQPGSEAPAGSNPHHVTMSSPPDATPPELVLSTEPSSTSPAFFRTVAHLGVQAAEALEHAHAKGIIHRDIKPANLLIDVNGNLWITDFGLARMLSEAGLTMTGDLVGTLRYMSPEQALAKRAPLDHRTDIYSLSVTLYELLTLRPAYEGGDRQEVMQQIAFGEPRLPRRLNKAIPVELELIVRKAIGKNPSERYATAQELADDLRRFLDDKPIRAKKPTLLDWTRKWARRHPGVVATGIGGLFIAVVILAVSTFMILSAYRTAETNLYHSHVGQARALRQARGTGYRPRVWKLLQAALQLQTTDKNLTELRDEAVACMGDLVGLEPTTWTEFPGDVNAIALHPNGGQVAIGLSTGMVLLRNLSTGETIARLDGSSSPVTTLAFASDGARLVSGDGRGSVHVWEANGHGAWRLARTITSEPTVVGLVPSGAFPFFVPHFNYPEIYSTAISPDGKHWKARCTTGEPIKA